MSTQRSYTYICDLCGLHLNNRKDAEAAHRKHCVVEAARRSIEQNRAHYGHTIFDEAFLSMFRAVLLLDHTNERHLTLG
ncbi:predicted protein [Lichtheimia corymbifera JMRC:FSU:9682]|uniref:Uncharacterized protein n=1 Tax=Lichtheimia corymbifera JMRC:FSU:9682 TaxID=1263082 RepID=A0A068SI24_9FUNG|nr:predicted protein [Lichtheimia corymbifera JMRC:FSU:9682]